MKRPELALISLLGVLGAFVAYQALRVPRPAPVADAPVDSAIVEPDAVNEALIVEQVAATKAASAAERADVRRRIDAGRYGTYIDDVIVGQDSALLRWPDRTREPLRVWVQPVSTVRDWRPDFATTAQDAFVEWSDIGIPVRFTFVADSAQADVPVVWIDRVDAGQRIGITRVGHNGRHILSAQISVATHGTDGPWETSTALSR